MMMGLTRPNQPQINDHKSTINHESKIKDREINNSRKWLASLGLEVLP